MNISLGRALSTLALAAGLAVSTAGAASAETFAVSDAHGDVLAYDMNSSDDSATPAPEVANVDVLRTTFQHRARRIAIRVKYADLRRTGDFYDHSFRLVTNEGQRRVVDVFAGPQMWRGETGMSRPTGNLVDCDIALRIDYDTDVVVVSFPRSCAGNPRWVRIGAAGLWFKDTTAYVDDAQRPGRVGEAIKLSPRIHRG